MTMPTTMEKLFAQIFDQKSFIINQVKEQADLCAQQLASKLILDGITPPDWFHNPNFDQNAPNRNELEKEELISKLLRRPSRDSVSYSESDCSLYYRPVFTGGKGLNASSISVRPQGPNNDVGCSLNCVAEHADSVNDHQKEADVNKGLSVSNRPMMTLVGLNNDGVNSPQNETDARISSIYAAPDTSVARIQRSKSRQKALERRTNSKTAAKSCLSDENRTHHSYNGNSIPKIDFRQGTQEKCSSEAGKHNDIIAAEGNDRTGHISRLAKSSSSYEQPSFVNDHAKHGLSLENENLDGSIPVQPTGDLVLQAGHVNVMEGVKVPDVSLGSDTRKSSINRKTQDSEGKNNPISGRITRFRSSRQQTSGMSKSSRPPKSASNNLTGSSAQQSGHGIGVTEEVSVLDFSLGSYASKTSTTEKTQDTQRQNQPILGRITRSRSSSQQISGINKSSKQGTSASYKLQKGEDAVPRFVDASKNLVVAVETSQRLSDKIGEMQAISSNEGVLKPFISSNIDAPRVTQSRSGSPKESALGVVNLENAEPVVENAPTDVPAVVQPVDSGIKLVPITLASKPSSDCCMIVKPKQLNFDEIEECDLNETCSPLSKKRKMDGNALSSSKAADTLSDSNFDECMNDETTNLGLETDENVVGGDVEDNSKISPHNNIDATCEVSVSSKEVTTIVDEENRPGVSHSRESHASSLKMQIEEGDPDDKGEESDGAYNDEMTNLGLETNEDPVADDVEYNSKVTQHDNIYATCEVNRSPTEFQSISDEEIIPEESHSNKDQASSLKAQVEEGDLDDKGGESDGAYTSDKNFDECINDEMVNLGLETNEDPVADDVEYNFKVTQHDNIYATCEVNRPPTEFQSISDEENIPEESHSNKDHASSFKALVEEDDLCHEGKESAAGVLSKSTSSPFILSAIQQGNMDSEDHMDLGSSKSKQSEAGTNLKLSDAKLNSANANTWPMNQQRNNEDEPTCLSDSRDFRVHFQRDAILCNLEAPENDLHSLRESASIPSSEELQAFQSDDIEKGMTCKLPEETESVHELQVAEGTVPEVDFEYTETTCSLAADMGATNLSISDDVVTDNMTDSEDHMDLGSSKSKQSEAGTDLKLSDAKLNSANANTWPMNQQRNNEDHPTCLSDSRDFRVHIQRDAILCDLKAPENELHSLSESASIPSSEYDIEDEMKCKLPEETELVHELQAAEGTVTEVDCENTETGATNPSINDDVITDNMDFEISLPKWVSSYMSVQSSNDDKTAVVSDEILPVYESFIINEEVENENLEHADLDSLDLPSSTIERASILEQICKSAAMQTPLSQFSSSFTQHSAMQTPLYEYMAGEMFENMDLGTTLSVDEDYEADSDFQSQHNFATTPYCWESKNQYSSPMGKLWERSASSSASSSEKNLSSNPELTCFPIEEDPNSDEESDKDDKVVEIQEPPSESLIQNPIIISSKMNILTENNDKVADDNQEQPVEFKSMKYRDRCSSNSVDTEASVPKTRDTVKFKSKLNPRVKISRFDEDNRKSSIATRASSRGNLSDYKNKSIMRSGIPRSTKKEVKGNNIVSNISSFIPMVQQKQAAAVCIGKRDNIKVKALEAAEAAKRREEEKENERKQKKEALKLERARIGKENAIEIELNKKKKYEEQKKKEADMAARKRQREEEEKKQAAKKRKLVAEAQKNQKSQYEKSRPGKPESEKQQGKIVVNAGNRKGADKTRQIKNTVKNSLQQKDTELRTDKSLASVVQQVASNDCGVKETVTSILEKSAVKVGAVNSTTQELSYDMSPYQSDDGDDEEDDQPTKKFIPSWCSKRLVATVLPLQQQIDPVKLFPLESFCNMDEVLLPRRLQAK